MIEQAATMQQGEPLLVNAIAVGAGAFVLWMAATMLQVRDGLKRVVIALYGDPDSKEKHLGLTGDVRTMRTEVQGSSLQVTDHIREEMTWREENARNVNASNGRFSRTLSRIERKLEIEDAE